MRKTAKDKIEYFYSDRISYLESCYEELRYLEFNIQMIGISESLTAIDESGSVYLNLTKGYNAQLIISEINDDLNCSLDLIKSAYFKQSNQILRNTLELISQLLYTKSLLAEGANESPWIRGERGTDDLFLMTKYLKKKVPSEYKHRIKEIEKFYNLLEPV